MSEVKRNRSPSPRAGEDRAPEGSRHSIETPNHRTFAQDCMSFNGANQGVEAPVPALGGGCGLTVVARVRRTKDCGPAWDRLIDFGNGESKENIVINFQQEMMYEVRGKDGAHQALAVRGDDTDADLCSVRESFPANQWMHISLVHDADGTASIFWNGRLKARGKVHLPQRVHREKCYVGRSHWQDDPYFQGDIAQLHVFDCALSDFEVGACAAQRALPAGSRRPIISLADEWRELDSTLCRVPSELPLFVACGMAMPRKKSKMAMCGRRGCGGPLRCLDPEQKATTLYFQVGLSGGDAQVALSQLNYAIDQHREQQKALQGLIDAAAALGALRERERIGQQMANCNDAVRRAQAVSRMIRYHARLPTDTRQEASTGQMRSPPRIAAAVDPATGMYHGFAIYELRSGDAACGSRFHVYITDIFNVRCLLPFWTCWRPTVVSPASSIISLLQRKAQAEQEVVVLRALEDDELLEMHYRRLGFSSQQQDFAEAGLADSYRDGDLLYS